MSLRVLVACEFSGIVRDAFRKKGHDAWSCDILPCERDSSFHIQEDVTKILERSWDLVVAHPPCTRLCVSGARWFEKYKAEQKEAIKFFMLFANAPIKYKAIENPIGIMSSKYRKPAQIIQPWQFGHGETKATCLWLFGLKPLTPTQIVSGREPRIHHMGRPHSERSKNRSRSYQGIADAMASQWGAVK